MIFCRNSYTLIDRTRNLTSDMEVNLDAPLDNKDE